MNIKPNPSHQQYLQALIKMGLEKRLQRAFELSEMTRESFITGLRRAFPEKTETEINQLFLQRISKCYNRNY